ncbi:MAG: hypothetical protein AAF590_05505 [Pseudomonadota bacterium]
MSPPEPSSDASDVASIDGTITLPERPWQRSAICMAVFAVLAPPVGVLLGILMLSGFAVAGSEVAFADAFSALMDAALDVGVTGLYGPPLLAILPAAAAGAFYGWHIGWRGPVPKVGGVLAGAGFGALYFLISEFLGWGAGVYGASFSVVIAAATAFLAIPLLSLLSR